MTSASAGGAPARKSMQQRCGRQRRGRLRGGSKSARGDRRQQLDRTESLIGVRRDRRGPREIEEHELSVRSPPHVGETEPCVPGFAGPRHRARSPGSRAHDAPDANRTSAARSGMARPAAPRTRPNSPSPIGAPRASTAARAATRHAGSRRPAVSLAELRESRHDGEGSDRRR